MTCASFQRSTLLLPLWPLVNRIHLGWFDGNLADWKLKLPRSSQYTPSFRFIQFGRGPDIDYDPVCFDVSSRKRNREMKVVKIGHEDILCNYRVKVVAELAPSFEALAQDTVALASRTSQRE